VGSNCPELTRSVGNLIGLCFAFRFWTSRRNNGKKASANGADSGARAHETPVRRRPRITDAGDGGEVRLKDEGAPGFEFHLIFFSNGVAPSPTSAGSLGFPLSISVIATRSHRPPFVIKRNPL
jgi:hypothetical protein